MSIWDDYRKRQEALRQRMGQGSQAATATPAAVGDVLTAGADRIPPLPLPTATAATSIADLLKGGSLATGLPGQFQLPPTAKYPTGFVPGGSEQVREAFESRAPLLPMWAENALYQGTGGLMSTLGTAPLSPYEESALAELLKLSQQGAPGGRAYAGIESAIMPTWEREMQQLYGQTQADLARRGLTYSGRAGETAGDLMSAASQSLASTLAPYAMQGEELAAQQQGQALANLLTLGQEQYGRYFTPYSALSQFLGTIGGTPYGAAEEKSTFDWGGALSGIGSLLGGLGKVGVTL